MIYSFITEHKPSRLSLEKACSCLSVSRSGYFKHRKIQEIRDKKTESQVNETPRGKPRGIKPKEIKAFHLHKGIYGYRKVYHYLQQSVISCSLEQVRRLLRKQGLKGRKGKPFKPVTTKTDLHSSFLNERVFKTGETKPTGFNQVWGSDITYLPAQGGSFLYLVVFLDFYSRKIIGWDLSSSLSGEFVLRAFEKALRVRSIEGEGLIVHSDRGVQYTAMEFRGWLKRLGFIQSFSRTGNCYDNAYCESCFSLLKRELGVKVYGSMKEARKDIFEWIESWYNTQRLHSSLGYRSPVEFEKKSLTKGKIPLKLSPLFHRIPR